MGGDHKCPLCTATFTRPQHVGRHLRAHTGDRPYECKECPLRFARSDLLSRHVNKAHKPPEEGDAAKKADKGGKKARRKSIAAAVTDDDGDAPDADGPIASEKARRSSFAHPQPNYNSQANQAQQLRQYQQQQQQLAQQRQQAAGSQLQAQKLYPHHPLLASSPQTNQPGPSVSPWTSGMQTAGLNGTVTAVPGSAYASSLGMPNPLYSTVAAGGMGSPFTAMPMRLTGSEQSGVGTQANRSPNFSSWAFDFGFKKRACDQCNHSKVRCDFSDPCARCSHRNLKCSYNKPSKSRSLATPINLAGRLSYPMSAGASTSYMANSVSPVSQGSQGSHGSQQGISPNMVNPSATRITGTVPGMQRRGSFGSVPVDAYAPSLQPGAAASAQYLQQLQLQNQERQQLAAQQWLNTAASIGGVPSLVPGGYPVTATMNQPSMYPVQQQQPSYAQPQQTVSPVSMGMGPSPQQQQQQPQGPSPTGGTALQISLDGQAQSQALQKVKSSSASPGTYLAPTPALTLGSSQTTSPSNSEEVLERKNSLLGSSGNLGWQQGVQQPFPQVPPGTMQGANDQNGSMNKPDLSVLQTTFGADSMYQMPPGVSPTSAAPSIDFLAMQYGPDAQLGGMAWQPQDQQAQQQQQQEAGPLATIDPRTQFRSNNEDDDNNSVHGSSTASSLYHFEPEDNLVNAFEQGRRSSASHAVWTNAFDSMTLQDGTVVPASATIPDVLNDPFTASQVAQAVSQRRPTFPVDMQGMDGSQAKIPSMSDVKDLWKLFMSDPMTSSVTPSGGERTIDFGNLTGGGGSVVTPRPDMGRRTLSKSNSMPDLKSPLRENGPLADDNGVTPRAVDSKAASYMPAIGSLQAGQGETKAKDAEVAAAGADAASVDPSDENAMRKWTEEIRQRQASFHFQPTISGKRGANKGNTPPAAAGSSPAGSAVSPSSQPGSTASHTAMLPPDTIPQQHVPQQSQQHNRPMASIFQRSGALQQTLAPERAPSWGQSYEMGIPTQASFAKPGPSKLHSSVTASAAESQSQSMAPPSSTSVPIMAGSTGTSVPTSQARPGNKRLASQTLMALDGKKADLGGSGVSGGGPMFDLNSFDDYAFDLPSGGSAPGGITPGLQAMQSLWGIGSLPEMSGGKA